MSYYDIPSDAVKQCKLTNISDKKIKVQLYRVNLWEEIEAGDEMYISCDSSEEQVYYANLALSYGTVKNSENVEVPTVLKFERLDG